jgi:hypothetical protein
MAVVVTHTGPVSHGQLPAFVEAARELTEVHKRLRGPEVTLSAYVFGGEETNRFQIRAEFDSYAAIGEHSEKLSSDPQGRALLARLSGPELSVVRRLWCEVAIGDPVAPADTPVTINRTMTLNLSHDWAEAVANFEQGKKIVLKDGAKSHRVFSLEAGGPSPLLWAEVGFASTGDFWQFMDKTSWDPAVRDLRLLESGAGRVLNPIVNLIAERVAL